LAESAKLCKLLQKKVSRNESLEHTGTQKRESYYYKKQPGGLTAISESEIQKRRSAGECLKCAWPGDRKGAHRIKDCQRQLKQAKGTASDPRNTQELPEKTRESQEQTDIKDGGSVAEGDYA
jgi:hypothetical protein